MPGGSILYDELNDVSGCKFDSSLHVARGPCIDTNKRNITLLTRDFEGCAQIAGADTPILVHKSLEISVRQFPPSSSWPVHWNSCQKGFRWGIYSGLQYYKYLVIRSKGDQRVPLRANKPQHSLCVITGLNIKVLLILKLHMVDVPPFEYLRMAGERI